jgi:hypothetical protein
MQPPAAATTSRTDIPIRCAGRARPPSPAGAPLASIDGPGSVVMDFGPPMSAGTLRTRSWQPAPVAQRIEHLTTDQKVGGSNPFGRAIITRARPRAALTAPGPYQPRNAGSTVWHAIRESLHREIGACERVHVHRSRRNPVNLQGDPRDLRAAGPGEHARLAGIREWIKFRKARRYSIVPWKIASA